MKTVSSRYSQGFKKQLEISFNEEAQLEADWLNFVMINDQTHYKTRFTAASCAKLLFQILICSIVKLTLKFMTRRVCLHERKFAARTRKKIC